MKIIAICLALFAAAILAGVGWVMNLFAVVTGGFTEFTPELLIRLVGVPFPPVGVLAGWLL